MFNKLPGDVDATGPGIMLRSEGWPPTGIAWGALKAHWCLGPTLVGDAARHWDF